MECNAQSATPGLSVVVAVAVVKVAVVLMEVHTEDTGSGVDGSAERVVVTFVGRLLHKPHALGHCNSMYFGLRSHSPEMNQSPQCASLFAQAMVVVDGASDVVTSGGACGQLSQRPGHCLETDVNKTFPML